jgi:glycosyltransferase involved in cell wall biosynthesis
MRVHIVSLPHTQVTRDFDWCAYTGKVRRFGHMLELRGHDPVTYCGTRFDGAGKHVCVVDRYDLNRWFGGPWPTDRVFDQWDPTAPCWVDMNAAAVDAIREHWAPGDAIGIIAGRCQAAIADAFPGALILEWGIGYEGILDHTHHAFESQTWRHYVYGFNRWGDGRNFDTVIPNAFDPADYRIGDDDGYLLFLGRHTERKGLGVVRELAKTHRVVTAGQGGPLDGLEYRGVVLGDEKAELLAHATAVLVPTTYVEPFGGVAVEAMLSGVPAITTDFGAFTETVPDWARCNTLAEFLDAVDRAPTERGPRLRAETTARYGIEAVADLYDDWLARCDLLHRDGWYTPRSSSTA